MPKAVHIWIWIGVIALLLFALAYIGVLVYTHSLVTETASFTTEYGDAFRLTVRENGMHDTHLVATLQQKGFLKNSRIFSKSLTAEPYRSPEEGVSWGQEIVKSYQYEDMRIYQFNWCYIYTLDGGKTFQGLGLDEPVEDETVIRLIANLA